MSEFGECIWHLLPKSKGKDKMEDRWESGVRLGTKGDSGEVMIGTPDGVINVRSTRRKPISSERWKLGEFKSMVGVP